MMTSDDKVGGWVKKGQNHDDVILECTLGKTMARNGCKMAKRKSCQFFFRTDFKYRSGFNKRLQR